MRSSRSSRHKYVQRGGKESLGYNTNWQSSNFMIVGNGPYFRTRFHGHLIPVKSETSDNSGWIELLQMGAVWSESGRQFQEILNSERISGKSVSDWRENCKCGGKLSTHFSLITIETQMFVSYSLKSPSPFVFQWQICCITYRCIIHTRMHQVQGPVSDIMCIIH